MTNCQSWVVWINLRGHTIQRQATEDGNKSLVLFSMPFCIACPSTASCISVISVSGGTFYLASTWAESLSCRGCGCRCGGTMQSQYGLNTGERKWLEEGTRLSRFFFFYQQWVKIPIFSQRQYFQCAFELPMLFYCCWPTYNLPCQPPPKKKKKNQPELDPPDRRLPVNIATETLLPSLSPPSLPPTGAMRARLCSYSLTWLQDWGKGSELTYGLLCIVGYGFQLVNTGTSWKIALVFSSWIFSSSFFLAIFVWWNTHSECHKPSRFVTKTPYNVQSYCLPDSSIITLIATCVTLKNGNHLGCNTRRQLLENDDYLFYNHVCFGRECGAGIICGSVACQAKRSATVWWRKGNY